MILFRVANCSSTRQRTDYRSLPITATRVNKPLAGYDAIIVAGGYGTRALVNDAAFIAWLQTAADCPLKASVCTGSLLLGAAGFLKARRATTHPSAYQDLASFCASVAHERIVADDDV